MRRVEDFDVFGEAVALVFGGFVVGGFVAPGIAWIQYLRRNSVAGFGDAEAEGGLDFEFFAV